MTNLIQVDHVLNPITALAFLEYKSRTLLVAGEGSWLRIYEQETRSLLHSERIFESQPIHGISTSLSPEREGPADLINRALVWGGRSVCLLDVEIGIDQESQLKLKTHYIVSEVRADDWILDACFGHAAAGARRDNAPACEAVLLTSHNTLLALHVQHSFLPDSLNHSFFSCVAAGPRSVLYSAHVVWPEKGHGLVAAGTVFGEVLLWSFCVEDVAFMSTRTILCQLHHTFTGHEGSVFGVRISEKCLNPGFPQRVLASCSDDRTVRMWDISYLDAHTGGTGLQSTSSRSKNTAWSDGAESEFSSSLATAMGHGSRIWGLRFIDQSTKSWQLLSYGEDSTAQVWSLILDASTEVPSKNLSHRTFLLDHRSTFAHHSGKNIWSVAVYRKPEGSCIISTGGADGRLVSYNFNPGITPDLNFWSTQWSIREVYLSISENSNGPQLPSQLSAAGRGKTTNQLLFNDFKGHWYVHRELKSELSAYPSGGFDGSASFEGRTPTDHAYDSEYLYIENGQFTTEQGFTLNATRRYVYRFQESTATISAWFVKTDNASAVDYLFHTLDVGEMRKDSETLESTDQKTLCASGHHLCIDDDYQADYSFQLTGIALSKWNLKYTVKGPNKNYVANARYIRDRPAGKSCSIGESDGAIKTFSSISTVPTKITKVESRSSKADSFKSYVWITEDQFLTSTEQGYVLVGTLDRESELKNGISAIRHDSPRVSWLKIAQVPNLKSSCIATSPRSCKIALLGSNEGTLYLYEHNRKSLGPLTRLPGKLACLNAQVLQRIHQSGPPKGLSDRCLGIFASCLRSSTAHVLWANVTEERPEFAVTQQLNLDLPPNFIPTSSCFIESQDILVVGSRGGSLSIFDLILVSQSPHSVPPCGMFVEVHGHDTVTSIEFVPPKVTEINHGGSYILTTGRNGNYIVHQIFFDRKAQNGTHVRLQTVDSCTPPFGPNIEGAYFDKVTSDLLLWGFRSKQFVVWNESRKIEVMTIDCGGAHRNWAYTPLAESKGGGNFVWTKASTCNVRAQKNSSHQVFQYGAHGREIKAMALSPPTMADCETECRFLATGAEDTAIRIFSCGIANMKCNGRAFDCSGIFTKHTTGIQQLRWSSNGTYLFSAAGCEEFFAWRVRWMPCLDIGLVCEAQCPHVTKSSDLRIMDFDIIEIGHCEYEAEDIARYDYLLSMVYSDSSVRTYRYHTANLRQRFELLSSGTYTTYCLTQSTHLLFTSSIYLLTASTDGHIAFWPLTESLSAHNITLSKGSKITSTTNSNALTPLATLTWNTRIPLHQNSIKSLITTPLSPTTTLLITGGDDGALAFTRLTFLDDSSAPQTSTCLIPKAHVSAITAIRHLSSIPNLLSPHTHLKRSQHRFATSSSDQSLKIWLVGIDLDQSGVEGLQVVREGKAWSSVADASSMEACDIIREKGNWVFVAGIGMERLKLNEG